MLQVCHRLAESTKCHSFIIDMNCLCAWQGFASVSGQIRLYLLRLFLQLPQRLPSSWPDTLLLLLLLLLKLLELLLLLFLLMLCRELTATVYFILLLQGSLQGDQMSS